MLRQQQDGVAEHNSLTDLDELAASIEIPSIQKFCQQ